MAFLEDPSADDKRERLRASTSEIYSFFFKYAAPYKWKFVLPLTSLALAGVAGVAGAYGLGQLVEALMSLKRGTPASWEPWAVGVLSFELLSVALLYFARRGLASSATKSLRDIRQDLFRKLGELPLSYYDREPLGRIVTRITHDVEGLDDFFTGTFARLTSSTFNLVIVLGSMLLTDLRLGLLLTLATVPALLLTQGIKNKVRHLNREMARTSSRINAQLSEFLGGLQVIRGFGIESWSQRIFDERVNRHLDWSLQFNELNSWSRPLILFFCYLPLVILLGVGGKAVLAGTLSLGLFVTFVRYSERFSRPIISLAQEIHMVQTAFINAERVMHFLKEPTESQVFQKANESNPQSVESTPGSIGSSDIHFKNVWLSYSQNESNWALRDVSFSVKAGEKIGLAGRTGSGKSSTLALLSRLYEFQKGQIKIGDKDIRDFDRTVLRSQVGYVSQDIVTFRGTLRDNLKLSGKYSDGDLTRACDLTGLTRLLKNRGLGLDDEILEHGANLSLGERQLFSLTRVLLRNPAILVLDEATASMDSELEIHVHNAVEKVMENRTCFLIAHRLSTLSMCHRVFIFKDGQLIESGNPVELSKIPSAFSDLLAGGESSRS